MKLYCAKYEGGNESLKTEVKESTFLIEGYAFGDRLLEDVMFEVKFDTTTNRITSLKVENDSEAYFNNLDTKGWLKKAKKYAELILKKGDEVLIPFRLQKKYFKNGINAAFIAK